MVHNVLKYFYMYKENNDPNSQALVLGFCSMLPHLNKQCLYQVFCSFLPVLLEQKIRKTENEVVVKWNILLIIHTTWNLDSAKITYYSANKLLTYCVMQCLPLNVYFLPTLISLNVLTVYVLRIILYTQYYLIYNNQKASSYSC